MQSDLTRPRDRRVMPTLRELALAIAALPIIWLLISGLFLMGA